MYEDAKKHGGRGWASTAVCVVAAVFLALFALASSNGLSRHQTHFAGPAGRALHRGSRQVADDGPGSYPLGVSEVEQCKDTFQSGLKPDTVGFTGAWELSQSLNS